VTVRCQGAHWTVTYREEAKTLIRYQFRTNAELVPKILVIPPNVIFPFTQWLVKPRLEG